MLSHFMGRYRETLSALIMIHLGVTDSQVHVFKNSRCNDPMNPGFDHWLALARVLFLKQKISSQALLHAMWVMIYYMIPVPTSTQL